VHSNGTIAVSISGIAGPGGGSKEKPVGTVCFAWATNSGWQKVETNVFAGDRSQVRQQATACALEVIYDYLLEEK
jgi:nicotinamide-nucleotide amidase